MFRKTVSAIIVSLLMLGTLVLALNIQPVRASGTIYIRADGSIDPSTSPILTVENITYTLTGNIIGSLVVERDNIVIDGAGYKMTSAGWSVAIDLWYRSNVTVENLGLEGFFGSIYLHSSSGNRIVRNNITGNIIDYSYGIVLSNSSNNFIVENNIRYCYSDGIISMRQSSNNTISQNKVSDNYFGFEFYSSNNSISENNITDNEEGIRLASPANNLTSNNIESNNNSGISLSSPNNVLRKNSMSKNGENLVVWGNIQDFWNDIDASNTVDGKPVYYWTNESDRSVPLDAGYVGLINCTNITVQGLDLSENGITLASTANSTIKENNVTKNSDCINLIGSSNNSILHNNVTSNVYNGIELSDSLGNSIEGNRLKGSSNFGSWAGISLESSSGNSMFENNITEYTVGIELDNSSVNKIFGNSFTNNSIGIWLPSNEGPSNYNVIHSNDLTENADGITIFYSAGNVLYGNSIISSRRHGLDLYHTSNNVIFQNLVKNNGLGAHTPPFLYDWCGGIYVYESSNNTFYHNNIINNTEQVCDSAGSVNKWDLDYPAGGNYWSDYNGTDLYNGPWQNIFGNDGIIDKPHVIDTRNSDRYPLMSPYSYPPVSTLELTGTIGGITDPTFGTYYFPTSSLINVTATPSQNCIFDHWDLDGVNIGSANPYTATLNMSHSLTANFWLIGDVDNDGKVNIVDVSIAARAFGSVVGTDRWNPAADVDRNGKIDIRDIALTARNFGQQYP